MSRFPFVAFSAHLSYTGTGMGQVATVADPSAVPRGAEVRLPRHADGAFSVTDPASGLVVRVTLDGARPSPAAIADGYVTYAAPHPAVAALLHRVHRDGTEDHLLLERAPPSSSLSYQVALGSRVAGLRLVGGGLELVDAAGAPRLRVAPPALVDAAGVRHEATLSVEGCATDTDPSPPWGRAPVAPGAARCTVRIAWSAMGVTYPALLDPSWQLTGSMSIQHYQHTGTLLPSGKVLVVGGMAVNAPTPLSELYDPLSGTWALSGSLNVARFRHTANLLPSNKLLICGGSAQANSPFGIKSCESYDPLTGVFTVVAPMLSARYGHTATLLQNGRVLAIGGADASGLILATSEIYDPLANTWAPSATMANLRFIHTADLLQNGKVLVSGGITIMGPSALCELYDPLLNQFSATGSMAQARNSHLTTILLSGKVLVVGGANGAVYTPITELYDPIAATWSFAGNIPAGRTFHSGVFMQSGRYLVTGGFNGQPLQDALIYDPIAATWSTTVPMTTLRFSHTGTLLANNAVIEAGGSTNTAELYVELIANGSSCTAGPQCQSGFCADGVCCNAACTAQCAACNLPGKLGVCSPASAGPPVGRRAACASDGTVCGGACDGVATAGCAYPGINTSCRIASCANGTATLAAACDGMGACPAAQTVSCAPYVCAANACLSSCMRDADCIAGDYCNAMRQCVPSGVNGTPCTASNQCQSTLCVDGYCCDTPCIAQCAACNVANKLGTCSPVAGDPQGLRTPCATDFTVCGGLCDGVNVARCAYPGANVNCRMASCANNTGTAAAGCNGMGACPAAQTVACSPYVCGATACLPSCMTDRDCIVGDYCNPMSQCVPKLINGIPCTAANQCQSSFCVDGVCCDTACAAQCAACNVANKLGTCSPVAAGPPAGLRRACASDGTVCGGACDGTNAAACAFPGNNTSCRMASCANGTFTAAATCNGMGQCPAPQTTNCTPYICGNNACRNSCATDADCVAGYYCNGMMQCAPKAPNGTPCTMGTQCMSTLCVDGFCCDTPCTGQCAACNLAGKLGACSAVMGAPVGMRGACASDGTACGGACDGVNPAMCSYAGMNVTCRAPSCANGTATLMAGCNGAGMCPPPQTTMCGTYTCGATSCLPACKSDADCVAGFYCAMMVCTRKGPIGQPCAGADACDSGFCVDGVCCNAACADQCAACNLAGSVGTCSAVTGKPVGSRAPCKGAADPCAGSCDGKSTAACKYPDATVECAAARCEAGQATTAAICDGIGGCTPGGVTACPAGCSGKVCGLVDMSALPDLTALPDLARPDMATAAKGIEGGGCACGVGGHSRGAPWAAWLVAAIAFVVVTRRRR